MSTPPNEFIALGDLKHRFLERRKLLTNRETCRRVAETIRALLAANDTQQLRRFLSEHYPADLADAMLFLEEPEERAVFALLDISEAAEVLDEVDTATEAQLLQATDPERLADILESLPADEGADIVGGLPAASAEQVLKLTEAEKAADIRELLAYPKDSAGGIMSPNFVAVPETATAAEALQTFRESGSAEHLFYVYVVDARGALAGMIDLRRLLIAAPEALIGEIATENITAVLPTTDQEQVANIFARYDLTALPVIEPPPSGRLLGVITADDIIDVIQEELAEDVMHMAGSDVQELEKRTPAQIAVMRMPWLLTTMLVELLAGVVIHFFDRTLARVLLLASFMPIISAISGNTGLQSATIIVRGLATGHIQIADWWTPVRRQVQTTLLLGGACGLLLGVIGAIWYGKWTFGVIVCVGMFIAVNIAGVVGTVVPLLSKRLGFDPALTAGPFETAFQDVVGISIFLTLATVMMPWLL